MSDSNTPRLIPAAKEFNIGKDTLVEFLVTKGFDREELKPTSKLTEDMYKALLNEFSSDKAAKQKSDTIDLPKGAETKKRREDEDISIKEKVKKADPIVAEKTVELVETPPVIKLPEPEPIVVPQVIAPQVIEPLTAGAPAPVTTKIEAPEVELPKIITKIDLSTIDSSTKPKKATKKTIEKANEPADKETIVPPIIQADKVATTVATPIITDPTPAPVEETVITKIQAEQILGPKILGKIELPVDNDTRPKRDDKRKRKRIVVENKGTPVQNNIGQQSGRGGTFTPGGPGRSGGQGYNTGGGRTGGGAYVPGANRGTGTAGTGRFNRNAATPQDKEIDKKAIQEKIRETQAKLAGSSGRGKSLKAKYRRDKRNEAAENNIDEPTDNKLQLTEFISVSELASLMDVSFAEVIGKCMSLGIMVSINQRLDAEVIELVASEFGYDVEFIDVEKQMELEDSDDVDSDEDQISRPPIVTIMGHVDHGKTSLLDYIRRENVVAGEAGGITQHIGAYEVTLASGKQIAFLDTPGHEAFTAMRARGAKVTDIAVIVVAADDAVMPQTKEAISHAQAAGVPMIFAINKMDRDGANPQKIYEQLAGMNVLVESWGGKFQSQELSAKQGLNVDALLDKILLEAEMLDLKANPDRLASGTIIEASLDKGRGYQATILVQNGTLDVGDLIVSGQHYGRIKAMFDERNNKVKKAGPSTPVLIIGLNGAPQAGEKFRVYNDEAEAKEVAYKRAQLLREQGIRTRKHITLDEIGRRLALGNFKELNLILKGDVDGSVEALSDSLQKLSTEEVAVKIVLKGVGQISESDVQLAVASDAIILGFNVRPSSQANKFAETEGVEIKLYSIIYKAIEEIKSAMEGLLEPKFVEKIIANVAIREVYKFDKATVAGCFVTEGKIYRNSKIRIIRDGIVVYPTAEGASAELQSLKRYKDDVKEVNNNMECGLTIKNYNDIRVGDVVEAFEEEEVKRTL